MVATASGLYNIGITNTPLADQYAHPLADPLIDFSRQQSGMHNVTIVNRERRSANHWRMQPRRP